MINEQDQKHLHRCIELAAEALAQGNEPFGSLLVGDDGTVLAEDYNRVSSGDRTRHPEIELARWAAANISPYARRNATIFTSGEHCPMCAAAHGWVGLGRIVYACSSKQLAMWMDEWGVSPPPVRCLPIQEILPNTIVEGPEAMTTANKFPPLFMLGDFRHLTPTLRNRIDTFNLRLFKWLSD